MTITESAAVFMEQAAADDSHGYDQGSRWGPDYDCSSLVISAWRAAGVPLSCSYTGDMRGDMLRRGFEDVTSYVNLSGGEGLERGDVLLNERHHTALYLGGGELAHASCNENGGARGGRSGDQTGREVCVRPYYDYPWDCVLRFTGDGEASLRPASLPLLRQGSTGRAVMLLQLLLWAATGIVLEPDGEFGPLTLRALLAFQRSEQIEADGIAGDETWSSLGLTLFSGLAEG